MDYFSRILTTIDYRFAAYYYIIINILYIK